MPAALACVREIVLCLNKKGHSAMASLRPSPHLLVLALAALAALCPCPSEAKSLIRGWAGTGEAQLPGELEPSNSAVSAAGAAGARAAAAGAEPQVAVSSNVTVLSNTKGIKLRSDRLNNFVNLKGPEIVQETNVVLILVGDEFKPCTQVVLHDVLQSLDSVTTERGPIPEYYKVNLKNIGCMPTVTGWWKTIKSYVQTTGGRKLGGSQSIAYWGSYKYSSAEIADKAFTNAVLNDIAKDFINPNLEGGFEAWDPLKAKVTIPIVILGNDITFADMAKFKKATKHYPCALAYYKDNNIFKGWLGGVVLPSDASPYWAEANCVTYPQAVGGEGDYQTPNNCRQADILTTHMMTALADLFINPTQFTYTGFPFPSITVKPGHTCKDCVKSGRYLKSADLETAGSTCDMRYMLSDYTVTASTNANGFTYKGTDLTTPEAIALKAAKLRDVGYGSFLVNLVSEKYLHFVQPYRFPTTTAGGVTKGVCKMASRAFKPGCK